MIGWRSSLSVRTTLLARSASDRSTTTAASAPEATAAEPASRREAALWGEGRRRTGELRRRWPIGLSAGNLALVSKVTRLDVPRQVRWQLFAGRRTLRGSLRGGTGLRRGALLRGRTLLRHLTVLCRRSLLGWALLRCRTLLGSWALLHLALSRRALFHPLLRPFPASGISDAVSAALFATRAQALAQGGTCGPGRTGSREFSQTSAFATLLQPLTSFR